MSGKQTLAQQLEATRAELREAQIALASSRSHGAQAEKLANERKAEIADLRDMVHTLELDQARMSGYLARIGEEETPPPVINVQARPREFERGFAEPHVYAASDANVSRAWSGERAPWYRRS